MTLTRHPLDLFSLLAGLATTTLAVVALTDSWTRPLAAWFWPTVLVAGGVLLLGVALGLRPGRREQSRPADPAGAPPPLTDEELAVELRDDAAPDPAWVRDAEPDAPQEGDDT